MKAFIGLLILCGTYLTQSASVGVSHSSVCADQNDGVLIPVVGDCSQFYICLNGKEVLQSCGASVHFDPESSRCIEASKSHCIDGLWSTSSQAKTDDLEKAQEVEIPLADICQGKAIGTFLPSRTSCSEFYVCIGNVPILKTCSVGLHYDVDARACIDEKLSKCVVRDKNPVEVEEHVKAVQPVEIENQLEVNIPVVVKADEAKHAEHAVEQADIGNNFDIKTDFEEVGSVASIQNDETDHVDHAIETDIGNVDTDEAHIVADIKEAIVDNGKINDFIQTRLPLIKNTEIVSIEEPKISPNNNQVPVMEKTDELSPVKQVISIENIGLPVITKTDIIPIAEIELPVIEQAEVAPVNNQANANPVMEKIEVSPVDQIASIENNALPVITKQIEEVVLPVAEENEILAVDNQVITVPVVEKTDVSPVKEIISIIKTGLPVITKTDIIPIKEVELPVVEQPEDSPIDNQVIAVPIMEKTEASLVKQILSMKKTGLPVITKTDFDSIEEKELSAIDESEAATVDNGIIEKPEVSPVKQIISAIKHTEESHIDKADVIVITKDDADKLETHDTGIDVGYVDVNHEEEDNNTEVVLAVIDEGSSKKCVGVASGSFFPKAGNCREFITCESGVAFVGQCPAGLHFNADLKFCDWPELAGCEDRQ